MPRTVVIVVADDKQLSVSAAGMAGWEVRGVLAEVSSRLELSTMAEMQAAQVQARRAAQAKASAPTPEPTEPAGDN